MQKVTAPLTLWIAVLWLSLPLAWGHFSDAPYFLDNTRGLQNPAISVPFLVCILCWAIALSIPALRTPAAIHGAGGFLLAVAFVLSYFNEFANTAGFAFLPLGMGLLRTAPLDKRQ